MDTNKMRVSGTRPFVIVAEPRVWGVQHVIRDAEGRYHGMVSLSGDSKQRRQQRRALLSQVNSEVAP